MIDVHAHAIPSFLREALDAAGRRPSLQDFPEWSPDLALAAMDRLGVARSLLSVSAPGVHFGADAPARDLARRYNDLCAELGSRHGDRFGAFAALPLPDVEGACLEAVRALDTLGLEGVGMLASYPPFFAGDKRLHPLMAELDRREAIVFLHPAGHASSRELPLEQPLWMLEYPIDTTRAALNLILSGTVARFPRIRFILAHAGGALPYLAWRLAAAPLIDRRYAHIEAADIRAALASFYYETAQAPGDEAFGTLLEVARPERILLGTDWPYCRSDVAARMIEDLDAARLPSSALKQAIRAGNAEALFAPAS